MATWGLTTILTLPARALAAAILARHEPLLAAGPVALPPDLAGKVERIAPLPDPAACLALADHADLIVHPLPDPAPADPWLAARAIVEGTAWTVEACLARGRRLLVLSSPLAYGLAVTAPLAPRDVVCFPAPASADPAALAYATADAAILAACQQRGLDACVIRPFGAVSGLEAAPDAAILPRLARAAACGAPLVIDAPVHQAHTFCAATDLAHGIIRLALASGTRGQIVNLGHQRDLTSLALAHLVRDLATRRTGRPPAIHLHPRTPGAPLARWVPDLTTAALLAGWEPERLTPVEALVEAAVALACQTPCADGDAHALPRS